MTTKTIKTILFGSLIAAMIFSFGGINYAMAEPFIAPPGENPNQEKIDNNVKKSDKLIHAITILEKKIANTDDISSKKILENRIEKLQSELDGIISEMADMGIPTIEEYFANKQKYNQSYVEVIESNETVTASSHCSPSCNHLDYRVGYNYLCGGFVCYDEWTNNLWFPIGVSSSYSAIGITTDQDSDWVEPYLKVRTTQSSASSDWQQFWAVSDDQAILIDESDGIISYNDEFYLYNWVYQKTQDRVDPPSAVVPKDSTVLFNVKVTSLS